MYVFLDNCQDPTKTVSPTGRGDVDVLQNAGRAHYSLSRSCASWMFLSSRDRREFRRDSTPWKQKKTAQEASCRAASILKVEVVDDVVPISSLFVEAALPLPVRQRTVRWSGQ